MCVKYRLCPFTSGSTSRVRSPSGDSILMTSAPRSASTRPHNGPAITCDRSRTRTPASGAPSGSCPSRDGSMGVIRVAHAARAVPHRVHRRGRGRPAGSARPHPLARRLRQRRVEVRRQPGVDAGDARVLARRVRLRRRSRPRSTEWDHFRVVLDDVPLHYIHARGKGPNPMPLVLTHGWPWTFWDFQHVIGPLVGPGRVRRRSGRRVRRGRARAAGLSALGSADARPASRCAPPRRCGCG